MGVLLWGEGTNSDGDRVWGKTMLPRTGVDVAAAVGASAALRCLVADDVDLGRTGFGGSGAAARRGGGDG